MTWHIADPIPLGAGTFGTVYLVRDDEGNVAARKILHGTFKNNWESFHNSFQIAARINHRNCIQMKEWISGEHPGWIMEYFKSVPLSEIVTRHHEILLPIKVHIAIQVCHALNAIHSNHIIHRDLKPQNILVNRYNEVKVTDLDLAAVGNVSGETGVFAGTYRYASPEQRHLEDELDIRSDLFSLGILLHELFCGVRPAESGNISSQVPIKIQPILRRLLRYKPEDRFPSAQEVALSFNAVLPRPHRVKVEPVGSYLLRSHFVDRERALTIMKDRVSWLSEQHGSSIVILGSAGSGKTRLWNHLKTTASNLFSISTLTVKCLRTAEGPYQPLRNVFMQLLKDSDESRICYILQDKYAWVLAAIENGVLKPEWRSLCGHNPEYENNPALRHAASSNPLNIHQAVADVLKRLISEPLILCFDDVHLAPRPFQEWLVSCLPVLRNLPLFIVSLHRQEEMYGDSPFARMESHSIIRLPAINVRDTRAIISSMLGRKGLPDLKAFATTIHTLTKGNPLFVREMMMFLHQKSVVFRDGTTSRKWMLDPHFNFNDLPVRIENIFRDRVAALDHYSLRVLERASLIGKTFTFEVLWAICPERVETDLREDLVICQMMSLIEKKNSAYHFFHEKLSDSLSLVFRDRDEQEWKRTQITIAEMLRNTAGANDNYHMHATIANHYLWGDKVSEAVDCYLRASGIAKKKAHLHAAFDYADKAAKAVHSLDSPNPDQVIAVLEEHGILAYTLGGFTAAHDDFQNLLTVYDGLGLRNSINYCSTYMNIGICLMELGRFSDAEKMLRTSWDMSKNVQGEPEEKDRLELEIRNGLGWNFNNWGRYTKAIQIFKPLCEWMVDKKFNDEERITVIHNAYIVQFKKKGHPELYKKVIALYNETLSSYGENHHLTTILENEAGVSFYQQGDRIRGRNILEKNLQKMEDIYGRFHHATAIRYHNVGVFLGNGGDVEEGIILLQKAFDIFNDIHGMKHVDTNAALFHLGRMWNKKGLPLEAERHFRSALDNLPTDTFHEEEVTVLKELLKLLLDQNRIADAQKVLMERYRKHTDGKSKTFLLRKLITFCKKHNPSRVASYRTRLRQWSDKKKTRSRK